MANANVPATTNSFFSFVSPEDTVRVYTPDGENYIELKANVSKKEFNALVLQGPRDTEDRAGGLSFADKLVDVLVTGWSFDEPWSFKNYQQLNARAANWMSQETIKHFTEITKADVEVLEGKDSTSDSSTS